MSSRFLQKDFGHYMPSFNYLKVNSDLDFKSLFHSTDEGVLTHEYIHFLQDISTTFGLTNTSFTVDFIKSIYHELKEKETISLPVKNSSFKPFLITNIELFDVYYGSHANKQLNTGAKVTSVKESIATVDGNDVLKVKLNIGYTGAPYKHKYYLGAIPLMESMANIIENHIYNSGLTALPYSTAQHLVDYLHPSLSKDIKYVAALCDIALMSYHPGREFFFLLNEIKSRNFHPTSIDELYDFAYGLLSFENEDGSSISIEQLYSKHVHVAQKQVSDLITADVFKGIGSWVSGMIDKAHVQRTKKRKFYIKLLEMPSKDARDYIFDELMYAIGVPLMFNNQETCWTLYNASNGYDSPLLFRAMFEVYNMLRFGKKSLGCGMINGCDNSPTKITTDKFCMNGPWQKSGELCPFNQVWHMWGLSGKKVIFNS